MTPSPLNDSEAMEMIAAILSSASWRADTLDEIADIVTQTGRDVLDLEGYDDD